MRSLRERSATLKKVEDRTRVERGDLVLAEIEGFADGKPLEGAKISQRILEVSPERLAHGLDEVLVGAEVGQSGADHAQLRADYAEKDLAGKSVEWRATVKEIYTKVLPELDDEFAKDLGDVASLDELREKVREQLVQRAHEEANMRARQGLLDLDHRAQSGRGAAVARRSRARADGIRDDGCAGGRGDSAGGRGRARAQQRGGDSARARTSARSAR